MKNIWTQKNGEDILIKDMTNNHIINTIKMLDRNISSLGSVVEIHGEIHDHMTLDQMVVQRRLYDKKQELEQELFIRNRSVVNAPNK